MALTSFDILRLKLKLMSPIGQNFLGQVRIANYYGIVLFFMQLQNHFAKAFFYFRPDFVVIVTLQVEFYVSLILNFQIHFLQFVPKNLPQTMIAEFTTMFSIFFKILVVLHCIEIGGLSDSLQICNTVLNKI